MPVDRSDEAITKRWTPILAARRAAAAASRKALRAAQKAHINNIAAVTAAKRVLARHRPKPKPPVRQLWHPDAIRDGKTNAGSFTGGSPKIVWHTTEGSSLPDYPGSAPHFTLDPRTGKLWQHIPINMAARALEHPPGTLETNRANAIQVELIGKAAETKDWPDAWYTNIAQLARWIETNALVPRTCSVVFSNTPQRMTQMGFVTYKGHCGHQHVPSQLAGHWDPGALQIDKILDLP